ncbi:MAG: hypothetical protein EBS29_13790 [Chloroflexia bacterium]|nr:hypothetical protein [Chloroflexia bacterium]
MLLRVTVLLETTRSELAEAPLIMPLTMNEPPPPKTRTEPFLLRLPPRVVVTPEPASSVPVVPVATVKLREEENELLKLTAAVLFESVTVLERI